MARAFWNSATKPIAIAHRGGGARYGSERYRRENTLETFEKTHKLGYEYLELDVTSTKDDKVIVLHVSLDVIEKNVRKDAPDAIKMQSYTYQELRKLLARDIPTLEEVLNKFPECRFFIDTKTDGVVEPIIEVIKRTGSQQRVFLNSFYPGRVRRLQKLLGSQVDYGLIISRYPRFMNRNYRQLLKGSLKNQNLTAIILPYRYLNKKTASLIHDQGMKLVVWTPNSKRNIKKSIRMGVEGIISDNAELLINILAKRG